VTVGQIFTKTGSFIENRQMFMLLNCNCPKLANFEDFYTCSGGPFLSWTQYIKCIWVAKKLANYSLVML